MLADDADSITTSRFKALDLHVMSKPDLTPVTDADEAVEESIRRTLSRVRSRDAITGEEQGSTGHSQRRWVIDPIDGTKNFVRGVPGLGHPDRAGRRRRGRALGGVGAPAPAPLVGLVGQRRVDRPVAAKATRCTVSDVRRLEDASLSYSSLHGWEERDRLEDFLSLMRRCWRSRAYGDFWSYMLLAEGAVDIADRARAPASTTWPRLDVIVDVLQLAAHELGEQAAAAMGGADADARHRRAVDDRGGHGDAAGEDRGAGHELAVVEPGQAALGLEDARVALALLGRHLAVEGRRDRAAVGLLVLGGRLTQVHRRWCSRSLRRAAPRTWPTNRRTQGSSARYASAT